MSRSRSAMRTWAASQAFTVATMATGFLVTPIVLHILGKERNGIAKTLTEVLAYLNIVSLGITIALVPRMASAIGRKDRDALDRCLAVGIRLYAGAACVVLLVGLAATPYLDRLVHAPQGLRTDLRISWFFCLCCVPLTILSVMKALLDIAHKGYIVNLFMAAQGVLTAVLTVVLVWAGWGVAGMMLAILVVSALFNLSTTIVAMRNYPHLLSSIAKARPRPEDWRAVLVIMGPTLVAILSERVGVLSDSILLTTVLNGAAATTLDVTKKLASMGQIVMNSISNSVWPSLAEMYAKGEVRGFNIRLVELTRLVGLMGASGLAPVIAYNPHFVNRWLGTGFDGGRAIVIVVSCNAVLLTLLSIYNVALVSTGKVARLAKSAAITAFVNIGMSVALTKWLGPIGPVLGTLAATLSIQAWYVPLQLRRVFGTSLRRLFLAVLVPICWAVPYTTLLCMAADGQATPGWFLLLGEMAVAALLFLIFGIRVIFGPDDRSLWNARLLRPLLARIRG